MTLSLAINLLKKTDPKKLEFYQKSHARKRNFLNPGTGWSRDLVSQKKTYNLSDHIAGEIRSGRSVMSMITSQEDY